MNEVLQIKGNFSDSPFRGQIGHAKLKTNKKVVLDDIINISRDIIKIIDNWEGNDLLEKILLAVHYKTLVPKSSRISRLFLEKSKDINECVVGAKFSKGKIHKHIITYYFKKDTLMKALEDLKKVEKILINEYDGVASTTNFNDEKFMKKIKYSRYNTTISVFRKIIVDISNIEKLALTELNIEDSKNEFIVSFYETEKDTKELLRLYDINISQTNMLDNYTVKVTSEELNKLKEEIPYLLAMGVSDLSQLDVSEYNGGKEIFASIKDPKNEPTIGVIDGLFSSDVYFNKWVDYKSMLSDNIPIDINTDYNHGTMVSSIIVDGHRLNPELDDGCGHFRVRHFGVSLSKGFSSFFIVKKIRQIVSSNRDIKVWNISLGSNDEINRNFISAEAHELDKLQYENDCIFVIAATNKKNGIKEQKIGSPADSINGLVVASVDFDNKPSTYSRTGMVLSFFIKPDISYYGGTRDKRINAINRFGKVGVYGTSFAAPWISRKLSYLIDVLGLNREVAKALIIDSAIGWERHNYKTNSLMGHGIVPINIKDIIKSPKDEIRFLLSGISKKYETYNYLLPIPKINNEHPFIARATLAYFPKCSRQQGVDYTNTELSFRFGRIDDNSKIKTINDNSFNNQDSSLDYLEEKDARAMIRKWDNVKHIKDKIVDKPQPRKAYSSGMWGLNIKSTPRTSIGKRDITRFGIVVTLKEVNGINRIDEFIKHFSMRGWLVNKLNVENRLEIFETLNEEIEWN